MKTRSLVSVVILFPLFIFAQTSESETKGKRIQISTRFGLNTLNEFNLQLKFPMNKRSAVEFGIGYYHGLNPFNIGDNHFCEKDYLKLAVEKRGFIVKFGADFYDKKETGKTTNVLLVFRNIYATNFEEVRGGCADTSFSRFFIYDLGAFDSGIMIYRNLNVPKENGRSWYFGCGLDLRVGEKRHSYREIDGTILLRPKLEKYMSLIPRIDLGWRIRFNGKD